MRISSRTLGAIGAASALLALASPVFAQDASPPSEDWDLTVDADRQLTLATVDFGENLLALRCRSGALDLLLTGVPVSVGTTRNVRVSAGAIVDEDQVWVAQVGQPVLGADEPARLARQLRAGGELDVRIDKETDADRSRRYRLTAPASAASVNTVLTACGLPLDEPRDLIPRSSVASGPVWKSQPEPRFPDNPEALRVNGARVQVSCIVGEGLALTDCRVESESPTGLGFGASALAAARRAEIGPAADGSDARGRLIRFTVRFAPAS